jgi:NAD dependent epimerase/dehydratase family enzyme
LVLGGGGALAPLKLATLFGAGARVGTGRQWWPWISLRDEVRAIVHLIDSTVSGPVNLVGPKPATATTITRSLATALLRPHLFVIPAFAVKLLGEAGFELLLSSHRLTPDVLLADGFRFQHPTASNAVRWAITD